MADVGMTQSVTRTRMRSGYPAESVDQPLRHSHTSAPAEVAAGVGRITAGDCRLEALFNRIGPSVLLVHSAGGGSGFAVAQTVPDLVERIVAVEPVGALTDSANRGGDGW